MRRKGGDMSSLLKIIIALGLSLVAFAAPSFAQATRTWVSGVGDDVNPCSRTAPCKTFAGAISKTAPGGFRNAEWISYTIPWAAGGLRGTGDDLVRWSDALFGGRILKPESLEKMIVPGRLNDGRTTKFGMPEAWQRGLNSDYGMGVFLKPTAGGTRVGHSGDIESGAQRVTRCPQQGERTRAGAAFVGSDGAAEFHERELPLVRAERPLENGSLVLAQIRIVSCFRQRRDLPQQQIVSPRRQARFAQAIERERFIDAAGGRAGQYQPEPKVPVRRPENRLVEPAVPEEELSADGGKAKDKVVFEDRLALVDHLETVGVVVDVTYDFAARNEQAVRRQDVEVGSHSC